LGRRFKTLLLTLGKWTGLFHLSRRLTARGLRILCYHAFELDDESRFRPQLFMSRARFARRLDTLRRAGFVVLPLAEALARLRRGDLPANSVVITIDDGFWSVLGVAAPELSSRGFPATLYVSTYYVLKQRPVFRLATQYLMWRSTLHSVDIRGRQWLSDRTLTLDRLAEVDQAEREIIRHGDAEASEDRRQEIARDLAGLLGVDYDAIVSSRALSFLTPAELEQLAECGIDIQLHTHRHGFPGEDRERAFAEIRHNREVLEKLTSRPLVHFCYPSGEWAEHQWPWLEECGIESATTCLAGFNYPETPPLGLRRFLDGENISDLEFEAEVFGFLELLRRLRGGVRRMMGRRS
jgi:peptidoglycan/xylan/chitin deacetylase (PgdA/CDA1 family)